MSPITVRKLARTGQLPALRVGGSWRFTLEEVQQHLENERRDNTGQVRGEIQERVSGQVQCGDQGTQPERGQGSLEDEQNTIVQLDP